MEPHEELQGLTELAMFGGPFFFSLLFGIVFIKMSHSYLITAMKRTDPPAEKFEKKLYERYFYASMIATFILSAVSVTWWIYSQNQLQTFQAVIQGVKISQTIVANENDIYLRTVQRDAGPGGKIRDYHFAIVSSNPFTKGQQFSFNYYPDNGSIEEMPQAIPLVITYSGSLSDKYRLIKNGTTYTLSKETIHE